ncbi:MAG TPA: hypothetical protein VNQ73_14510 [Ilumatobacter sp.]|nr:hypothetical protein [Ilumatobacter sp.]
MPSQPAGDRIIQANVALTMVFALSAVYAAAVFDTTAQWVGAATAMTLFAIGVFAFLWSYWAAVQRSRTSEIAVSQLYLLLGPAIPGAVKRAMLGALVTQVVVALATTLARPNGPDGNPGSSLAVGFLVPMLGFGLNGLWAARHATFAVRAEQPGTDGVRESAAPIGQNAEHG